MEHNEYAVHEVKIRYNQSTRHEDGYGNTRFTHETKEETFLFIAPGRGHTLKHWGNELLALHIEEEFRFAHPLFADVHYEILSHSERPIKAILRISTAYRSQL